MGYTRSMKNLVIVKMLFSAYIGLIILFNLVTIPSISLPGGQLFVSFVFIAFIMYLIFAIRSKRKVVWWGFIGLSILGVLRPALEYIFSLVVPGVAENFFPPFTPVFSVIGFLLMLVSFILMLDPEIKKGLPNP